MTEVALRVQDDGDGHGNGHADADEDELSHVNVEDAGDAERTGRRRNHGVRDDEAAGEGSADADDGLLHGAGDGLGDRGHDDEAGVTENRDGDEEAGNGHGFFLALLAEEVEEGDCHALGGAGDFENLAEDDAEADDDAYAGQRSAEALGDGHNDAEALAVRERFLDEGHAADNADDDGGDDQSHESVDFGLQHQENQNRQADDEAEQHLVATEVFNHKPSPLLNG